jgi:translation initiation factor 1
MGGRVVYTTGPSGAAGGGARACPHGHATPCRCEPRESLPPERQTIHARVERAGRGGKTVTVAGPFALARGDAEALLAAVKKRCGTGGTARTGVSPAGTACFFLEVQGDHTAGLLATLAERGYRVRR